MKQMKTIAAALAVCGAAGAAMAFLYGDTPDARHAWAVHDRNRPNPVKVSATPQFAKAPSDAVVLFDGTPETFANWTDTKGNPTKWKLVNGTLESVRGAGYIMTKQKFGDCQLHLEWAAPSRVEGFGQGRGNSGVFLMGNYEIQVLDSFETDPSKNPNPNPNYADGQASAVYAENPPLVNASLGPGEWQSYDIVFHQPVWQGNKMVYPGSVTVFHNGVLTQDHWEMEGLTTHCRRRPLAPHDTKLPLQLQDHGNPVHFRNIWIREIPSRYANTTHGGPAATEKDVMALRQKTAAELFAKVDFNNRMNAIRGILEVASYDMNPKYQQKLPELQNAFLADFNKLTKEQADKRKWEVFTLRGDLDVLIRNGVFPKDNAFRAELEKIIAKYQLKK